MRYFAMINDVRIGPLEIPELADAGLMPDTYVWCKGMDDWKQAKEVADICRYFRNRIFDKMHPQPTEATSLPKVASQAAESNQYLDEFPLRYRRIVEKSGETVTPRDDNDYNRPPSTWFPFPMILALLMFPPLGLVGTLAAIRAKQYWGKGLHKEAHELARLAKLYGGIAFFIGVIVVSALARYVL